MRSLLGLVLIAALGGSAWAQGPSFDCAKAKTPDEIAICGDPHLAQLDRLVALAFDEARRASGRAKVRAAARDGAAARAACGSDAACIQEAQVRLIVDLQALGANVKLPQWATASGDDASDQGGAGGLPTEVGQCVNTTIARIGSRFQDDINASPDDGSAVEFENGGAQVSYEKEPGLLHAPVGDPVLMCLVELPQDCPPGDDRGKIYTTTDLRTHESWTLPDSQHSCGGA